MSVFAAHSHLKEFLRYLRLYGLLKSLEKKEANLTVDIFHTSVRWALTDKFYS